METKVTKTTVKAPKVEEKKSEVKAVEAVKAPVAEAKPIETKAEAKAVKAETKTTAKAAKTTRATKAVKETKAAKTTRAAKETKTAETTEKKTNVFVQYAGREYNSDEILAKIKETILAETGKKTFKSLDVYIKPEDSVAYYVVNGKPGSISL